MRFFSKKKTDSYKEEELKEVVYIIITKVVIINNRTDKEYEILPNNDFGLNIDYNQNKYFSISRALNKNNTKREVVGIFYDFSILNICYNEKICFK